MDHVDEEVLKERKQVKPGLLCVLVVEDVSLFMSMASLNIQDGINFLLSPSYSILGTRLHCALGAPISESEVTRWSNFRPTLKPVRQL
jgi:hypothetical protein